MRFFIEAKGGDKPAFLTSLKQRGFRIVLFAGDTSYDQKAAADAGVLFFRWFFSNPVSTKTSGAASISRIFIFPPGLERSAGPSAEKLIL